MEKFPAASIVLYNINMYSTLFKKIKFYKKLFVDEYLKTEGYFSSKHSSN